MLAKVPWVFSGNKTVKKELPCKWRQKGMVFHRDGGVITLRRLPDLDLSPTPAQVRVSITSWFIISAWASLRKVNRERCWQDMFVASVRNGKRGNVHRDKDGVSSPNWRGVQGGEWGELKQMALLASSSLLNLFLLFSSCARGFNPVVTCVPAWPRTYTNCCM